MAYQLGASWCFSLVQQAGVMEAALRTVAEKLSKASLLKSSNSTMTLAENYDSLPTSSATSNSDNILQCFRYCKRWKAPQGLPGRYIQRSVHQGLWLVGGCVNGGGQPTQPASVRNSVDLKALRASDAIRQTPKSLNSEKSRHFIKKVYEEFLGEPNSHRLMSFSIRT